MKKFSFCLSVFSLFFAILATRSSAPVSFFEISSPATLSDPLFSLELSLDSAENPADTFQSSRPVVTTPQITHFSGIERVNTTTVDAGDGIKIHNRMLYAHSNKAFYMLRFFNVGTIFTAEIDGETATYRVATRATYKKSSLNHSILTSIYYAAGHDLSLMTCGDGSAASNDGNYRLVLFADRI